MFLLLPIELRQLILSFLTRKEYKRIVPCKSLLLCRSYLSLNKFVKFKRLPKALPIVKLSSQELEKLFIECCRIGNVWLVDKLIINFKVDPSACDISSCGNYYKISCRCMYLDSSDDPLSRNNAAICIASRFGRLEVVERLLQDPRVDPSTDNNHAIYVASRKGHLKVLERLLQDPRVDPLIYPNYLISFVLGEDPSAYNNQAIRFASRKGQLKVVERLLLNPRVDPSACNNEAVLLASEKGRLKVVVRLLQDPRVDPSAYNNYALRTASENGHAKVVEKLMQDPRVSSSLSKSRKKCNLM